MSGREDVQKKIFSDVPEAALELDSAGVTTRHEILAMTAYRRDRLHPLFDE
jgi:hypothetical protein